MKRMNGCICALLLCAGMTGCGKAQPMQSTDLFAMDTYMTLKVSSKDAEPLLTAASARIRELERRLSVTDPESEISRLNAAGTLDVSDDTAQIIAAGLSVGEESGWALDISVCPLLRAWGFTADTQQVPDDQTIDALLPLVDAAKIKLDGNTVTLPEGMMLDLGSLAKGYASDEVIRIFRENGAESAIVSLGGNVRTLGRKPDGSLWRVAVRNPFEPSENLGILQIEEQAVITSGNYERCFTAEDGTVYWHILDRSDGYPADNGLVSVTVVGDSGLRCDALSTALFVEGTDGAVSHWRKCGDFEMLCVTDDQRILLTEGLEDSFENTSAMPMEVMRRE